MHGDEPLAARDRARAVRRRSGGDDRVRRRGDAGGAAGGREPAPQPRVERAARLPGRADRRRAGRLRVRRGVRERRRGVVAVVPHCRRRGVGTAMLAEVRRRAAALGRDRASGRGRRDRRRLARVPRAPRVRAGRRRRGRSCSSWTGSSRWSRAARGCAHRLPRRGARAPREHVRRRRPGGRGRPGLDRRADVRGVARTGHRQADASGAELCFLALAGDEVVGYALMDVFGGKARHAMTATRRDWRRRGIATALKRAEIAAAKRAGFRRLVTESEDAQRADAPAERQARLRAGAGARASVVMERPVA